MRSATIAGGHARVLAAVEHLRLVFGESALGFERLVFGYVGGSRHVTVIGEHADERQTAALTDLVVVGVVGRGDLDDARTLFHVGVLVADDGDLLVEQRQDDVAAVEVLVSLVVLVDRDGGVAEHRFGTGGGDFEQLARLLDGVEDVPEVTLLLLVLNLRVGDGGVAVGAPVDHAVAAVDLALVVELDENLADGVRAALVHREALALPVAADAQLAELLGDSAAVLALPFPRAFEELLASEVVLGDALPAHRLNDFRFRRDGGVVGAGQPQRAVARHALPAD